MFNRAFNTPIPGSQATQYADAYDRAMKQGVKTAHDMLLDSIESIDSVMGEGFAKKHPDFTAQFLRAAMQDASTFAGFSNREDTVIPVIEKIGEALDRIGEGFEKVGEAISGIEMNTRSNGQ